MNSETGRILPRNQIDEMENILRAKYISVDEDEMTLKQRLEKQVSLHDNRSILGKLRVKHKNSLRNRPCPCGSGNKFKKCCWSKVA